MKNKTLIITIVILIIAMSSKAQVTGKFTDSRDGKTYKTVQIGTQTWMAENLAYKTSSGCWAYNNDQSNVSTYGYLYNWEAAKNVCPSGWHLPTKTEWVTLINYLGGENIAGGKLKSTKFWKSPNTEASNSSNFSANPGGGRDKSGSFGFIGFGGIWWSSTDNKSGYAWDFRLACESGSAYMTDGNNVNGGFSVRCVKDN